MKGTNSMNKMVKEDMLKLPHNCTENPETLPKNPAKSLKKAKFQKSVRKTHCTTLHEILRSRLKTVDIVVAILAVLEIILISYENEVFYSSRYEDEKEIKRKNESDSVCNTLRYITMMLAAGGIISVIRRYEIVKKLRVLSLEIPKHATLWSSGLLKWFLIELVICSLVCPPYVNWTIKGVMLEGTYEYSLDGFINILCLAKIYTVYRLFTHFSIWTNSKAENLYRKTCKKRMSPSFFIKAELSFSPLRALTVSLIVTLLYFAVVVRRFELYFIPL